MQFTGVGNINRITLQWLSSTLGGVKISKAYLVKQDGSKELVEPSVFWGCNYSDLEIVTGIQDVVFQSVQNDAIYNLQGQRVLSPVKGIYIRGGRKFMMK